MQSSIPWPHADTRKAAEENDADGNFVLDTRDVAAGRGFDLWSAIVSGADAPIRIEALAGSEFKGRIQGWSAHALVHAEINAIAHDVIRSRQEIGRGSRDEVKLVLVNAGTAIVHQGGHRLIAGPGDVVVCFDDRSFRVNHRERTFVHCVCVAARRFSVDIRSITPRLISKHTSVLAQLTANYIRSIPRGAGLSPETAELIISQLVALVERAIIPQPRPDEVPSEQSLYEAIVAIVDAEIANPHLSAKLLCTRLGASRSSLFAAIAAQGHTLTDIILSRRFAGCIQDMKSIPGEHTLAAIAERWGFAHQTSFNRAFRRRYSQTPTEWQRTFRQDTN